MIFLFSNCCIVGNEYYDWGLILYTCTKEKKISPPWSFLASHNTIVSLPDVFHIGLVIGPRPAVLACCINQSNISRDFSLQLSKCLADSDLVVIGLTGIGPIRKIYVCSVTFISITVLVISVIGVIGGTLFGKYLYKRQKSSDKSYQELITLLSANITINSSSSSSSSGLITSHSHPSSRSFHSSDVKHSTPLKLFSSSTSEESTSDSQSSEVINTFDTIEIIFNIIFICSSCIYSRIIINKRFYFHRVE